MRTDNRVAAHGALGHIGQVHGTALAASAAGCLAVDLGDHGVEITSLCQIVRMGAMPADSEICGSQHRTRIDLGCVASCRAWS